MLADELDYVIGVDTHRDTHALAVVAACSGGVVVVEPSLSACPDGYRRLLALAQTHAAGTRAFAVEGTGSYGAGLARFLAERGERVLEVEHPTRTQARRGKSMPSEPRAASSAPTGRRNRAPAAGGPARRRSCAPVRARFAPAVARSASSAR
jgi:transposase